MKNYLIVFVEDADRQWSKSIKVEVAFQLFPGLKVKATENIPAGTIWDVIYDPALESYTARYDKALPANTNEEQAEIIASYVKKGWSEEPVLV